MASDPVPLTLGAPYADACPSDFDEPAVATADQLMRELAVMATFTASADQVRQARNFTARLLDGWPIADEAILCVSELAANAVVHSASGEPGGTFSARLSAIPGEYVRLEVRDQGGPWVQRDQDGERPHGLDIVRRLATGFGVDGDAQNGWIVWARLDLPGSRAVRTAAGPDRGRAPVAEPDGPA